MLCTYRLTASCCFYWIQPLEKHSLRGLQNNHIWDGATYDTVRATPFTVCIYNPRRSSVRTPAAVRNKDWCFQVREYNGCFAGLRKISRRRWAFTLHNVEWDMIWMNLELERKHPGLGSHTNSSQEIRYSPPPPKKKLRKVRTTPEYNIGHTYTHCLLIFTGISKFATLLHYRCPRLA